MTKIIQVIEQALNDIDSGAVATERRALLQKWVEDYGIDNVCAATGLKASTVLQYLRDTKTVIGRDAIEQGQFVFTHPVVLAELAKI